MADQKPSGDEIALRSSDTSGTQREGECLGLPRWKASSSAVDDSGTESGEDLRLLSPEVLREIQSALSRLEGALPGIAPGHRETVSELVNRLQSCLRVNPPSVPPQPPPRRFGNKRSLKNRHTVSVTSEELASARRWISENDMERKSSVGSLNQPEESLVAKVFRPVKFTLPVQPPVDRSALPNPLNLQKMQVIRKVFCKPMLHRAGYFMEPCPQVAAVSYIEPVVGPPPSVERSFSDSGSLVDYDPSLSLFTPEQSVQIAVHKAAINKQISQEGFKRRESSDDGDVSSTEEDVAVVPFSGVSSAQRLLQLASDHPKKSSTPSRFHNRSSKKVKIKRANTIDIPKSASFYDHSSGEEYGVSADEGNSNYVTPGRKLANEQKLPPPTFQPKTENDLKFLAFLKQANETAQAKVLSYNPSARGGKHWSNRFSNIKNAFEGQEKTAPPVIKSPWQNPHSGPQPKLPNKPHQVLQQPKLPWSVKTEEDGVVVGSLTVKRPPGPINQFTHAPKSAFKPVEKKSSVTSSASGTVKQLATQKFSVEPPKPVLKQYLPQEKSLYKPPEKIPQKVNKPFVSNNHSNPPAPQLFSSSTKSIHRHFGKPQAQNLAYNPSQPNYNSNNIYSDELEQAYRNAPPPQLNPTSHSYNSNMNSHNRYPEPSFVNDIPPAPTMTAQNYSTNTSYKPVDHETNFSKSMLHDNGVLKFPPAETYLKSHPQSLNADKNSFETTKFQPDIIVNNVPVENNHYNNSHSDNFTNGNPATFGHEAASQHDNYLTNGRDFHINSINSISDEPEFKPNYSYDRPVESDSFNHHNGSYIPNSQPQSSDFSYNPPLELYTSPPLKEEPCKTFDYETEQRGSVVPPSNYNYLSPQTLPKEQPGGTFGYTPDPVGLVQVSNNLLSPHNLPVIRNDCVSPGLVCYNNVSPRPSPIGPMYPKSPSLKYDDDDSVSASPYMWANNNLDDTSNRSSPCEEEKIAVSKVMGQSQCQQAVMINNRTRTRFDTGKKIESELLLQVQQSARQKALSPSSSQSPNVLQKSESWHQIVKEQMQQAKQAPPLPKISKAKSSHSLAFPKQFEASLKSDNLSVKQSTVSQYLQGKVSPKKSPTPARREVRTLDFQSIEDYDENVDEVFENILRESNKKRNSN